MPTDPNTNGPNTNGPKTDSLAARAARSGMKGMTLLEIMIVIAILGLVAATLVVAVLPTFERSKIKTTKIKIGQVKQALGHYYADQGNYPDQSEGLSVLLGSFLKSKEEPKDAWGEPFVYYYPPRSGGTEPEIISKGPDKQEGSDDDVNAN